MNTTIHPLSARDPDTDTLSALLSDRHRRHALAILLEDATVIALDELAEAVAADVHDSDPGTVSREVRERIRVELHHHHLPKLEHARLIDYDARTNTVIPLRVEAFVDHLPTDDDVTESELPTGRLPRDRD